VHTAAWKRALVQAVQSVRDVLCKACGSLLMAFKRKLMRKKWYAFEVFIALRVICYIMADVRQAPCLLRRVVVVVVVIACVRCKREQTHSDKYLAKGMMVVSDPLFD
jgi:hypothetical protein